VQISDFLGLLGGLALFLYGMQMMSSGLEAAAGDRMKGILERLTANRFLGVLVGAVITAVIQSSSATTVMVVGFVNAGIMTLNQAVWIIMGANIGTTVTGLLIALDVGVLAPLFAFAGVVLVVFVKKQQFHHIGQILAGLGVLFIGMDMMSAAMSPLRDEPAFVNLMSSFSNPLLGILFGAVFTAVIQSSSASVGILQTLAASGAIGFSSAVFVLFGQNIGTCITAVLAAVGTSRSAKRTTVIHLLFNLIGTAVFTALVLLLPVTDWLEGLIASPKAQIAAMHTAFNIVTTLLLLPLGNHLARLAVLILPELPEEEGSEMHLEYLTPIHSGNQDGALGSSAIYLNQMQRELRRMLFMARSNLSAGFHAVLSRDAAQVPRIEDTEEYLDFLNKEISRHISAIISLETNERSSAAISSCFAISGNIERIGDHAMNICGYAQRLAEKHISFSPQAQEEIVQMQDLCLQSIDILLDDEAASSLLLSRISLLEQKIDDWTVQFRRRQIDRMRAGTCSEEACVLYSELLTDFERIGDHALNIGQELAQIQEGA
jgi:phosphate:Na+ symporter